ncbi:ABC-type cobalamin/Fe3+-siderophores transport system, ATPase components [Hahella chejuensis KCTC 2396]|uniref:ABC-type cobalamin/Fe3+-siderophores transport system, ATPase components n=1 Tax=Hahella chejuensis (strain KCTC 2396) TaxID=349521 RepID=Q2S7C3_HAHCH|nr:ABC transporter ATP-binding protein [Hahella chejuensis]ABC33451.1 ABC-type cobalamin/Fe3+-siderophores transport system, ATPase components [Hahella chejuensis KCTC 2396]
MSDALSLELSGLQVGYPGAPVLSDVSFRLPSGQLTAILGSNGAGKSTLLKTIVGLIPKLSGAMRLQGQDLCEMAPKQRAQHISYLDQDTDCHWPLTVETLVSLGRFPAQTQRSKLSADDQALIQNAMRQADVTHLAQRTVTRLSGGERARVMLARALAVDAPVLMADEPVAGLDPQHQIQVMSHLQNWARQGRIGVVVLHDLTLALRFCGRAMLAMPDGTVVAGGANEVLSDERIQQAFGVSVVRGRHEEQPYLLPWSLK